MKTIFTTITAFLRRVNFSKIFSVINALTSLLSLLRSHSYRCILPVAYLPPYLVPLCLELCRQHLYSCVSPTPPQSPLLHPFLLLISLSLPIFPFPPSLIPPSPHFPSFSSHSFHFNPLPSLSSLFLSPHFLSSYLS